MSCERQRAIPASTESQRSVRRPALARAWLVSVKSCCSDVDENELSLQPRARPGSARRPALVATRATASISARWAGAASLERTVVRMAWDNRRRQPASGHPARWSRSRGDGGPVGPGVVVGGPGRSGREGPVAGLRRWVYFPHGCRIRRALPPPCLGLGPAFRRVRGASGRPPGVRRAGHVRGPRGNAPPSRGGRGALRPRPAWPDRARTGRGRRHRPASPTGSAGAIRARPPPSGGVVRSSAHRARGGHDVRRRGDGNPSGRAGGGPRDHLLHPGARPRVRAPHAGPTLADNPRLRPARHRWMGVRRGGPGAPPGLTRAAGDLPPRPTVSAACPALSHPRLAYTPPVPRAGPGRAARSDHGGLSYVSRASDCGSEGCGFKPRRPPHRLRSERPCARPPRVASCRLLTAGLLSDLLSIWDPRLAVFERSGHYPFWRSPLGSGRRWRFFWRGVAARRTSAAAGTIRDPVRQEVALHEVEGRGED